MKRFPTMLIVLSLIVLMVVAASPVAATEAATESQQTEGVSPADPGTKPPQFDSWRCPNCGEECCGMRQGKRMRHPMPAEHGHRGQRGRDRGMRHGGSDHWAPHARGPEGRGGERGRGISAERLLHNQDRLKLTDDQVARLEKLAHDTKLKMIDLRAQKEKEQLAMKELLRSGSDDLSAMKKQLKSLSQKRAEMQELRLENLIESRKILTDEQKELIRDRHPGLGRML